MIQDHLVFCLLNDVFVHTVGSHQSVNLDFFLLANSVRSSDGLKVVLRVEVRVKYDDYIGCLKIDSQTTSFCGEELFNATRSAGSLGAPINLLIKQSSHSRAPPAQPKLFV